MMKEAALGDDVELQDIKKDPIEPEQLQQMVELVDNTLTLFSKRSRQYRKRGLHERQLSDEEMQSLILEDYTFLNRPVYIDGKHISCGQIIKKEPSN